MNWKPDWRVCCMLLWLATAGVARTQTVAERYLFQSVNDERVVAGLQPLKWNAPLTAAARTHAEWMRRAGAISHQFKTEPDLAERAAGTGTHFSRVAENVASSPSILQMHSALMNSPHHRDNILDPQVDSIGISVVSDGRQMWGVEDFAHDVRAMTTRQQEAQVAQTVMDAGIANVEPSQDARDTCSQESGFVGSRPAFVMRYTASDLTALPQQLKLRLGQGRYTSAAVGACTPAESSFTTYSVAVILYK